MTEPTAPKKGTVEENVSKELKTLVAELKGLAEDVGRRISLAGEETKKSWDKLDAERKRFFDQVERAADETRTDMRRVGSDLKKRLQGLQVEIMPKSTETPEAGEKPDTGDSSD